MQYQKTCILPLSQPYVVYSDELIRSLHIGVLFRWMSELFYLLSYYFNL